MDIIHTDPDNLFNSIHSIIQVFKKHRLNIFLKLCSIQSRTTNLKDVLYLLDWFYECSSVFTRKIWEDLLGSKTDHISTIIVCKLENSFWGFPKLWAYIWLSGRVVEHKFTLARILSSLGAWEDARDPYIGESVRVTWPGQSSVIQTLVPGYSDASPLV